MPLEPASNAYEALVSVNFMLYFDQGDNLGYVDGWLPLYWKGEDLSPLLHCIMKNVLALEGWTISLGPEYSDLTRQWLCSTEGLDRPLIELRVTKDMPDEIWNVALERVLSGTGQPAFYNEEALQYIDSLIRLPLCPFRPL